MRTFLVIGACLLLGGSGAALQIEKATVPGVTNFTRVDATIACAGATTPAAVAEVKKLGYRSIVNLRQPGEVGAELDAEAAAASEAGLRYIHLPFNHDAPDAGVADQFLKAVADPANQPVFIHCASGSRAASLWMIKRMIVDGWDADRAGAEAAAIGLKSDKLKAFAIDYARSHAKWQEFRRSGALETAGL